MTKPDGKPSPNPYRAEALKEIAEGADRLHAKAAFIKPVTLTDAESAARARAKLEGRNKP